MFAQASNDGFGLIVLMAYSACGLIAMGFMMPWIAKQKPESQKNFLAAAFLIGFVAAPLMLAIMAVVGLVHFASRFSPKVADIKEQFERGPTQSNGRPRISPDISKMMEEIEHVENSPYSNAAKQQALRWIERKYGCTGNGNGLPWE